MALNRRLAKQDHIHEFSITHDPSGWEILEEEDKAMLRRVHHEDWHRVERDSLLFDLRAHDLKRDGWVEV